jgi:hypothetical protein
LGDSIGAAGDALDAETGGGGGGDAGEATEVGTETVGIATGSVDVGAAAGLAPSDGTGAAAISAVPAP